MNKGRNGYYDYVHGTCYRDKYPWDDPEYLQRELWEYESRTQMNSCERSRLRKWVAAGHSCYDPCDSKYMPAYMMPEHFTWLDVYRLDEYFDREYSEMSQKEKEECMREFFGYLEDPEPPSEEEIILRKAKNFTPGPVLKKVRMLCRELDWLWMYVLDKEGIESTEAREYVNSHMKEAALTENDWPDPPGHRADG